MERLHFSIHFYWYLFFVFYLKLICQSWLFSSSSFSKHQGLLHCVDCVVPTPSEHQCSLQTSFPSFVFQNESVKHREARSVQCLFSLPVIWTGCLQIWVHIVLFFFFLLNFHHSVFAVAFSLDFFSECSELFVLFSDFFPASSADTSKFICSLQKLIISPLLNMNWKIIWKGKLADLAT